MSAINTVFIENKGYLHTKDNVSILSQLLIITKENLKLSLDEKTKMGVAVLDYLNKDNQLNQHSIDDQKIFTKECFVSTTNEPIYKYVSNHTYNEYIKKGCFRLGSIQYYQTVENINIQDSHEGFTSLFIDYKNRALMLPLVSGYNFAIFCGTSNVNTFENMNRKFGNVLLKIKDPSLFANDIKLMIGAKKYYCYEVKYSTQKVFAVDKSDTYLEPVQACEMTSQLFDHFYVNSFLPSLFIKPTNFKDENEIRIAFEMSADLKSPIDIESKELIKHIEIINAL